jgi:hypothetical protein
MARMYGAYAQPRCPRCRAASGPDCADASREKGGQRKREERQWRRDVEEDIRDVEQELRILEMVEKTWLPRWYVEDLDLIWVRP